METINCNLCGKDDYRIIFKGLKSEGEGFDAAKIYKSSGNKPGTEQVVRCNNCSFTYVNPRLKASEIIKGYTEGSDQIFVSQAKGREITFDNALDRIEKYVKPGKVLDIGTAGGSFLAAAKKRGWDVYGNEPNKWLVQWAKKNYGIKIEQGISTKKFKSGSFDIVTLWDVLEHVPDPAATLKECQRLVKKGGYVYINYPDIDSGIAKLMGKRWIFYLSVHIFYFTPKSLSKYLRKYGFTPVKFGKHWQKLSLGYLVFRMKAYNEPIYKIAKFFTDTLQLNNIHIPYWLGQTYAIAKK